MTFLSPIAGLIAGGLAIGVLAALHILKLRRVPMRVSSVWLWEAASKDTQANVPWQRLRFSQLLFVQLLALLLLAAAIGRPVLTDAQAVAEQVIVLVDASASMGARDVGAQGTRLERSLAQARDEIELLRRGRGGVSVAVLEASSTTRVVEPFTNNVRSAGRAMDRIVQTEQAGDLPGALSAALSMLAAGSDSVSSQGVSVLVFSDGVSGASAIRRDAVPAGVRIEHRLTPGLVDAAMNNVGIASFHVSREAEDSVIINCFAQLMNTNTEAITVPVVLEVDGISMYAQEILLPGATQDQAGHFVFSAQVRSAVGTVVRLQLQYSDVLDADNTAQSVLAARHTARAMIVAPEDGVDPFLLRAIEATGTNVARTVDLATYEQSWSFQPDVDLLVFDRTTPAASPLLPTLSFGSTAGVQGLSLVEGASSGVGRLLSWRREHPVMSGVGIGSVLFDSLDVVHWDENDAQLGPIEVLARGVDGPCIVYLEDGKHRRVIVSAVLAQSTWPVDVSFAVFMSNVIPVLTPGMSPEGFSISTSETDVVEAAPGAERVRVSGPQEMEWPIWQSGSRVVIGPMPMAGVYQLDGVWRREFLAVNLENDRESSLRSSRMPTAGAGSIEAPGVTQREGRRELWPWLLLGGLVVLMFEWGLSVLRLRA